MQIFIILVIVIIFIANQIEKNKKNNRKSGTTGVENIVPKPNNTYQVNEPNMRNSGKAFRESSTYRKNQMMNEQIANREAVIDVLTEFNESVDKKRAKNETKKTNTNNKPIASKKKVTVESANFAKPEETVSVNDTGYGRSIFDDFAASDALYLARKDVENRRLQKILYI